MLSSSMVIAMRFVVISFLRATMFEKIRGSMVLTFRKFSHLVRVWIQHAIQKSIGMGRWQNFLFFKILTDFNEAKEYGKSEIFQSQPLTSAHRAVLCGINDTLTHNFVVYCPISTKKYG